MSGNEGKAADSRKAGRTAREGIAPVSYTHLRAHET